MSNHEQPQTATSPASPRAKPQAFIITEKAAARIKQLMLDNGTDGKTLLVGVKTKGCSGLSYDMRFADAGEIPTFAETVHQHDVTVAVDPKAAMFLFGTVMDYVESELKSGFEFLNPNETGRCGCGESFTVKKD